MGEAAQYKMIFVKPSLCFLQSSERVWQRTVEKGGFIINNYNDNNGNNNIISTLSY